MLNLIKRIGFAALVSAVFLNFMSCSRGSNALKIRIIGSDTMVNLMQSLAEEFMKANPTYLIAVTGGGSGTGMASLLCGGCEIASSSRKIKEQEIRSAQKNGINPFEVKIGLDGIAVVVNPANPLTKLTIDQLADVFTGRVKDWKDLDDKPGKIVLLSREVNSGTHIYFKEHVLQKGDTSSTAEFAPGALLLSSSQAIADEIANNTSAIGYYGMGYLNPKEKAVMIAKDKKSGYFAPSLENVVSGKYPISRPLFLYTNGEPQGIVKEFVDFCLSPQGQEIVKKTDFVPIN